MNDATTGRSSDPGAIPPGCLNVLPAGARLADRYRIVSLSGAGATGMVYRAHDERLHVDVALKVLRPEKAPDANVLERFEQELLLARQVTHRNVVRIHDIGRDGDLHFLTMDHVEGRSLRQILDERGRLEVGEAVAIARDLAEALAAAHRQAVVHRDLKPANVLLDADGHAYITDFGVARSMVRAGPTRRGNIVGTLDYLAPEQARGGDVDGRSDIYALGLMLFEMLTGMPAFRGESPGELIAARSAGLRRRFKDTGIAVPRWLRRVVNRCLAPDPDKRYQNAAALAADLAAGRLSSQGLARRVATAALAVILLAGIAGAGWWWHAERGGATLAVATPSVAVLPLVASPGEGDAAWLATGLADSLALALAEGADLRVVDSRRVLRALTSLRLTPADFGEPELARLGELLDVDRLVTGRVRDAGEGVDVELRVIAPSNPGAAPDVMRADAKRSEIAELANRLAGQLATALGAHPPPADPLPVSTRRAAFAAYARGIDRLAKGDTVAAGTALEQAVAADSDFGLAWLRLAEACRALGFDDRALESAHKAVERIPERAGRVGLEARALAAMLAGDFGQAQQHLSALVTRYPHALESRIALAEAYGEDGKFERAREELTAVVAESPDHPRAWLLLGQYALGAGDARKAAFDYLPRALAMQDRLGDLAGRAEAQSAMGAAHASLGNLDEARARFGNVAELMQRIGDERGAAEAKANVARIELRQGRYDQARAGFLDALAVIEKSGDYAAVAGLYDEIGALEARQGRHRAALERYRHALVIRRDLDDPRLLATSYSHIGAAHYALGGFDDAAFYAGGAMDIFGKAADREGQIEAGKTLGLLAIARGEWATAEQALLSVLKLGREVEDPVAQGFALGQLGRAAQLQGKYGAALTSILQGLEALAGADDAAGLARLLLLRADLAFELGMLDAGREALAQAQPLLEAAASVEQRAEWWRIAGLGHLRNRQVEEARRAFARARLETGQSGSVMARLATRLGMAEAALAAGEPQPALEELERVHAEAQALGHVPLTLRSGELLARALAEAGQLDQAEKQLRISLSAAEAHGPWAGRYRLQGQLAEVLGQLGRTTDAEVQLRAASDEVQRLRKELDASQREAFEQLDEVRRLS